MLVTLTSRHIEASTKTGLANRMTKSMKSLIFKSALRSIMELLFNTNLCVYNTIQYNIIQYSTIQYNIIQYSTIQCNIIQYSTIQYNIIQYSTIQCNIIQYSTIQYNIIQYNLIRTFSHENPRWDLFKIFKNYIGI